MWEFAGEHPIAMTLMAMFACSAVVQIVKAIVNGRTRRERDRRFWGGE